MGRLKNKSCHKNELRIENPFEYREINNIQHIRKFVQNILETDKQNKPWTINIILVDRNFIIDLNKKYLGRSYVTDVISFNLSDEFDDFFTGEIYICYERVSEQAVEYNTKPSTEFFRVIAHGIFHLFGYRDESPAERAIMTRLENEALLKFVI